VVTIRRALTITSTSPVDLVVTEVVVVAFLNGCLTLIETALGITSDHVVAATESRLVRRRIGRSVSCGKLCRQQWRY
jgi:acyl CoA:acetate/3-ketoacid CoA transferase beta subunit